MPIRKKIFQFLSGVSGRNQPSQTTQSDALEPTVTETPIDHPEPIEVTKETEPVADSSDTESDTEYDLVLYGRPSCPFCVRVDYVIEELDIEDKITRRLTTYGSDWRTDLQNRTGSTQVPCLFINGKPMFESLDIIDWMRSNLA